MRKNFARLTLMCALVVAGLSALTQNKTMTWTTTSDKSRDLAFEGSTYMRNSEPAQAYEKFKEALDLDPDFTVVLTLMSFITTGETGKDYRARALKSAANKTEGEKLFASVAVRDTTGKTFRDAFTKLHDLFPDGSMIGLYYVFSRATPAEQYTAALDYLKKFPEEPAIYNTLGYMTMQIKKDTAAAKKYFESYIKLYPQGCNPYDSMGEFYFNTGDMANAEKYYNMALEKYPFNISSIDKLKEISDKKKMKK
jgi:tetratricopeptide (TPR) repeat protein